MINELGTIATSSSAAALGRELPVLGRPGAEHRATSTMVRARWLSASSTLVWATGIAAASLLAAVSYGIAGQTKADGALSAYLAAAPLLAGLIWSSRRPGTHAGTVLILTGFSGWLVSLQFLAATDARAAGQPAQPVFLAVLLYGVLALPGPAPRAIANLWAGAYAIVLIVVAMSSPVVGLGASLGLTGWWAWRFRNAARLERRELTLIGPVMLVLLESVLLASPAAFITALVLLPAAFLATLLRAEISAARALTRLVNELSAEQSLASWQRTVADALGDPSLRLVSWDPESGRFRDAAAPAADSADRSTQWVPIWHDDDLLAVMSVDRRAVVEPEVVRAVGVATRLAVESGYVEGELRRSMARLAAAADGERRRIARDLHDCAQQRLVTLRIHLSLAGESLDRPEAQRRMEELGIELDEALRELRDVSHGFYPVALSRYGVAAAIRTASSRTSLPVRVEDHGLNRHGDAIEQTVYFCCLEALQNSAKHAGPGASVIVRLVEDADELRFEVDDDGVGFLPQAASGGSGLLNLADRLKAVGGSLGVDSAPGRGARISGRIALA